MKKTNNKVSVQPSDVRQFLEACNFLFYSVDKSLKKGSYSQEYIIEIVRDVCNKATDVLELEDCEKGELHRWCWKAYSWDGLDRSFYEMIFETVFNHVKTMALRLGYTMCVDQLSDPMNVIFVKNVHEVVRD